MNASGRAVRIPPAIIVPVGPPACGKSTLAAKLVRAGLPASAVMSLDTVRGELCSAPCRCPNAAPGCAGGETCQCVSRQAFLTVARRADIAAKQGRPVYVDGTNLVARVRRDSIKRAHAQGMPAVALLAKVVSLADLYAANTSRDRVVPTFVIDKMHAQHAIITAAALYAEGFDLVVEWDHNTTFAYLPYGPDATTVSGPFFFIGDVHGNWEALNELLTQAGFDVELNHPDGLLPVLLGDVVNKGGMELSDDPDHPDLVGSVQVLRWALRMWRQGKLVWIRGNNERKLARKLALRETTGDEGVAATLAALYAQPDADVFVSDLIRFLPRLPVHLILADAGERFIAVHGGIRPDLVGRTDRKAENFCLYVRSGWVEIWNGPETVVYGHVIQSNGPRYHRVVPADASAIRPGATWGIDTGCYAGGGLTGLHSRTGLVHVPSSPSDRGAYVRHLASAMERTPSEGRFAKIAAPSELALV